MQKYRRQICACAVAHLVVEIQATIYNAARDRRLSSIFQVDTCKTKKERIAHVQLSQAMVYNASRVRSFSTKHAKVKKIDLCMRSCTRCT